MKVAIRPRKPTGTRRQLAFVDGERISGLMEIELPIFEPLDGEPNRKLRQIRVHELSLSLRRAAELLGIGVVQMSELERGHSEPDCGWDCLIDELTRLAAGLEEMGVPRG